MNVDQIREMIVTAGGNPSYDIVFQIPSGGDWSGMAVDQWSIIGIDHLRAINILTAH